MRSKLKASLTVEAAFILPIVIYVIYVMIYFGFYYYDVCSMQASVDRILNAGIFSTKHEADFRTGKVDYPSIHDRGVFFLLLGSLAKEEQELKEYLEEELKNLLVIQIDNAEVTLSKVLIKVKVEGSYRLPIVGILPNLITKYKVIVQAENWAHNPSEFIRASNVIFEVGNKIKGVEQLKEYLKKWKS